MGSGKTTVGRALARSLDVPFVDNDELLFAREGRTAAELAIALGPGGLHRAEADAAAAALADDTPRVLALAASVADDDSMREALRGHCVVWLRAQPATLHARLDGDLRHRPSASVLGESLDEQTQRRATRFRELASVVVDVDGRDVADIVREIVGATRPDDARPPSARETGSSQS